MSICLALLRKFCAAANSRKVPLSSTWLGVRRRSGCAHNYF
jgi:hypothetical protein